MEPMKVPLSKVGYFFKHKTLLIKDQIVFVT